MGNKPKSETWSPAKPYRIMAFARALATTLGVPFEHKPKASEIQDALGILKNPIRISDGTLRNWIAGRDDPTGPTGLLVKKQFPECVAWLEPDIESTPMRRFLCALDIWGSEIDGPERKLEAPSSGITVRSGLNAIAKRWAPAVVVSISGQINVGDFTIPRLKRRVPDQVSPDSYSPCSPLSLTDFMFRCGAHLQLSGEEFKDWAIDLASLTLMTEAYYKGLSLTDRFQSGAGVNFGMLFRMFFLAHGSWPNVKSIASVLEDDPEIGNVNHYAQRLFQAYETVNKELKVIGADLTVARTLFERVEDGDKYFSCNT